VTTHAFSGTGLPAAELQKAVGQRYHCGIGDGIRNYGYMFEPTTGKDGGFHWRTDTAAKDALIAYSSQQLIDRDFAFFPRVTDADFSNGGYQEVWLDPKKYFDSDLDPSIPGYLQLRPSWTRVTKAGVNATIGQVVAWKGDFWFTFGEANGNIYSASGGTTTVAFAAAVVGLFTDGQYLYAGFGDRVRRSSDGTAWTTVSATLNGTAAQWWVINQGTNGYFAYYLVGTNVLYKIDLTLGFPIAAAAQPQVSTGNNAFQIVDVVEFQTAISILTNDVRGTGCDVWYHDGTNMTRIVRIEGYNAQGMCNALGNLYVGAYVVGKLTSPELIQISTGSFLVVAKPGSPFPAASQSCFQPQASSNFVYWPIVAPSIKGISNANAVIVQYNLQTGAVTHLPVKGSDDGANVTASGLRGIANLGDSVAAVFAINAGADGVCQYQTWAFGTLTYSPSGWLASSHIDFGTPSIPKRFRRIEVHHAPLNAGERIDIEAFVDTDPLAFTTGLTPVPPGATNFNTTVGSAITAMTFAASTVGKTLYYAIKLTAGTSQLTTPRVSYVSIEVGGTWVADVYLACTARRHLLGQELDTQGASSADLAYLLMLSQENGNLVTFYHPNGQTYSMTLDMLDNWNPSPVSLMQSQDNRPLDEEYTVHAILRQVA
jgi:hypothetical protein